MEYQVLARKWRPKNFHQMVGQEHVLRALINALDQDRVHHAYLFTGTRGVGKTTIARIFAKCLNCENGVTSEPCGTCGSCVEVDEGRFIDLIEVDAASRTRVEDTRELLENVQYAPTRGRYKVYLIDEVHMLSTHSFNALLKTLEEPPPHVKFLLATTDPQKLPVTILSRCLQFSLKALSAQRISEYLQFLLKEEQITSEERALAELARAANGSMRDALSLTDQAIAFGGGAGVLSADVQELLGSIDRGLVFSLLSRLIENDGRGLLQTANQMIDQGAEATEVLAELIEVLHSVALAQQVPEAIDNNQIDREKVLQLAQVISFEDVQLYYQIALMGRKDLPLVPNPRSGLEMVLLRMLSFKPLGAPPSGTQGVNPSTSGQRSPAGQGSANAAGAGPGSRAHMPGQSQVSNVPTNGVRPTSVSHSASADASGALTAEKPQQRPQPATPSIQAAPQAPSQQSAQPVKPTQNTVPANPSANTGANNAMKSKEPAAEATSNFQRRLQAASGGASQGSNPNANPNQGSSQHSIAPAGAEASLQQAPEELNSQYSEYSESTVLPFPAAKQNPHNENSSAGSSAAENASVHNLAPNTESPKRESGSVPVAPAVREQYTSNAPESRAPVPGSVTTNSQLASPELPAQGGVAAVLPAKEPTPTELDASTIHSMDWADIIELLEIDGAALNFARNISLETRSPGAWGFKLKSSHEALYREHHVKAIEVAVQAASESIITLTVNVGATQIPTPAEQRLEERRAKLEAAEKNLYSDPVVDRLIKEFGASIDKNSIQALK
ncbi:MAG: DNA polymerase III subunit gamma/tau [Gammaproteobacteria bacterium]|nr:MAG: DNA polymerase III subunit gamma/tau [Gammaproteobacteria bacterium]